MKKWKHVISGGPGVGKTTLLERLKEKGHNVVSEAARKIIKQELEKEQGVLPWTDLAGFQRLVIKEQLAAEKSAILPAFLDRSLIDPAAYSSLGGVKLEDAVFQHIKNAGYGRVFLLTQLPQEFYKKDGTRMESPEKAMELQQAIFQAYEQFGCDNVEVGFAPVEERAELVLERIKTAGNREVEAKYAVRDFDGIRKKLSGFYVEYQGAALESNRIYDIASILERNGFLIRTREMNGATRLAIKGPDKGLIVKDRMELEFRIPRMIYQIIGALPEHASYQKIRETYAPLGDARCSISLDIVGGRNYVEIEAASESQVLLWKKRLGIRGHELRESYYRLGE